MAETNGGARACRPAALRRISTRGWSDLRLRYKRLCTLLHVPEVPTPAADDAEQHQRPTWERMDPNGPRTTLEEGLPDQRNAHEHADDRRTNTQHSNEDDQVPELPLVR
eukprot:11412544-Prorocentrum_lima.AAC.1